MPFTNSAVSVTLREGSGCGRVMYMVSPIRTTSTTTESEYTVGTLVVDIFNAKTKALVFRGTASDELSDKADKNAKKADKAANKMFKDFPPGSEKKK